MENRDHYRILGTPLLSDAGSAFKLSFQNKIAPTPAVYSKLRHNAAVRKERRLLDDSVQPVTKDDHLYIQTTPPSHIQHFMDDQDRAYLSQTPSYHGNPSSFLRATVDFPEISSKQPRTPLGYRQLHKMYILRSEETSQMHAKTPSHSRYEGFNALSLAPRMHPKSGLGYRDKGATDETGADIETKGGSDTVRFRRRLQSPKRGTFMGSESDEEDCINQLANSGYKNLDVTEKRMSRRLKEGRTALVKMETRKRVSSHADGTELESVLFTAFVQWRPPEKHDTEWTEYVIPATFAACPSHDSEKDHVRTFVNSLPPLLQQEYNQLLRVYKESMSKESETTKASIAKAEEEHEAGLRRLRGLVLEDMGARFVAPQAPETATIATTLKSHGEAHHSCKDHSTAYLEQGETNRTIEQWKPENLLCKRLGVEKPKDRAQGEKAPRNNSPGSSHSAEDFRIHSITDNKGSKLDASVDGSLPQGGIVLPQVDYDEEENVNDDRIGPSRDLIQKIFVNPRDDRQGELTCHASTPNRVDAGIVPRIVSENRGIHKTRAVDFF